MGNRAHRQKIQRGLFAYELASKGLTLNQIGAEIGRSAQTAHIRVEFGKRVASDPKLRILTCRALRVLEIMLGEDFSPERAAELTEAEILRVPNSGLKTVSAINEWLGTHGLALK